MSEYCRARIAELRAMGYEATVLDDDGEVVVWVLLLDEGLVPLLIGEVPAAPNRTKSNQITPLHQCR